VFGKRSGNDSDTRAPKPAFQAPEPVSGAAAVSREVAAPTVASPPIAPSKPPPPAPAVESRRSDNYYQVKATIFGALIEAIDLAQLAKLDGESAREEIRDIVNEIIAIKNIVMSIAEQEELLDDICNDVLGYGPLEPLLSRDDISDIMVNGAGTVFIEVAGRIQRTGIRFRDNQQLLNICQRIVSQVGRRVDESSPICDARLADGSRVNVIVPPNAGPKGKRSLLVFLHGRGGYEGTFNDAVFRGLPSLGGHRGALVAFPAGGVHGYWHNRADGDWEDWVMDEVIPLVERRFGIDPQKLAIGGISMGGFGAYDIALKNPGRFCAVGGHSPALWFDGSETAPGAFDSAADFDRNDVVGTVQADPEAFGDAKVWNDYGQTDDFLPYDEGFVEAMEAGDADFTTHSWPGGHEGSYWTPTGPPTSASTSTP